MRVPPSSTPNRPASAAEPRVASREAPGGPTNDPAALRKVADQLQGVFAEQLFKAMRETVPRGEGAFDGGSGEDMFTGLMDQHLAAETPTQWARGLTDSIVRQLRGALDGDGGQPPAAGGADPHLPAALPPKSMPSMQSPHPLQPLTDATR